MQIEGQNGRSGGRGELLLLLAASTACIAVLTAAMANSGPVVFGSFGLTHVLVLALIGGALAIGSVLVWRSTGAARALVRRRQQEIADLRRNLAAAESILKAEPQVLVYWLPTEGVKVAVHTLT